MAERLPKPTNFETTNHANSVSDFFNRNFLQHIKKTKSYLKWKTRRCFVAISPERILYSVMYIQRAMIKYAEGRIEGCTDNRVLSLGGETCASGKRLERRNDDTMPYRLIDATVDKKNDREFSGQLRLRGRATA